jgi:hypothetical protein
MVVAGSAADQQLVLAGITSMPQNRAEASVRTRTAAQLAKPLTAEAGDASKFGGLFSRELRAAAGYCEPLRTSAGKALKEHHFVPQNTDKNLVGCLLLAAVRNRFRTSCRTTPPTTGITGESPPGQPASDLRISWGNNTAGGDEIEGNRQGVQLIVEDWRRAECEPV